MNNIFATPSEDYRVDLPAFSGPLDLLLYLIKKDEVDIYDISISRITQQYLKYIDLMEELNLEVAGEFILMAATLIHLKARLLLPHDPLDPEEEDPREELIMALIEYKKYKEASEILRERALMEERYFVPESPVGRPETKIDVAPGTTLFDLITAFKQVIENRPEENVHQVQTFEVTIEDRIGWVIKFLQGREYATFQDLFADVPRRIVAVVTFIALLELVRTRRIAVDQSEPFRELRIYRGDQFDAPQREIDIVDFNELNVQAVG